MKVEFLVALMDHTWDTEVKDVPDSELPQWEGEVSRREPYLSEALDAWALENVSQFKGDIALIAVYCDD